MEGRPVYIALILSVLHINKVHTANRIFTCGVINEYPAELDAVNFAVSNTFSVSNISIILKNFNISDDIDQFNQASVFRQQNIVALIEGSHTNTSACALSTVTDIALIRLHGNSKPLYQCEKALQMSAGYSDYAHASLDILGTFRWEKIALVFDESRLHEAGYFHAISQNLPLTVDLIHLSLNTKTEAGAAPILEAMDKIKSLEPDVILLYTSIKNIELMLQQKPCKCNTGYKWILQGQVPSQLQCHPNNVVVAMKLPYIESQASKKLENVTMGNSKVTNKDVVALAYDSVEVINQALNIEPCSSINGTAITSNERQAISTCLRKVNMDGLTGSVQFSENGNRKRINFEILNLQNNSFKQIGTWNSTKGTVMFGNILRNVRTSSSGATLEGRKLRVVVAQDNPFVVKKEDNGNISYEGYCIDMLHELARILKFTFEINPSPDGFFGAKTANGTWNGMIGELVNERADIAVASLTITEAREKAVDFTLPYMFYTENIIMKKTSSEEKTDLLQFMAPFDRYVWVCTLGIVIIISAAVFAINYFSPYGYKDDNGQGTSEEFSYFNSLWFAFACMLQQGGDNTPRSLSGRILAGCYWFCILIWVSTYTANLAAFFTVKNAEQPIKNLEDLAKSTYEVGVLDSSSVYEAFESSQYETHKKIWQRMQARNNFPKSTTQGLQWVREKEKFVFIHDGPTLKYVANQPPCDLTIVPGLSTAKGLSFALQANDPHTTEFTLAILRLQESHFIDGLRRKWWEIANSCPEEVDTTLSRKQIGLMSMVGVYIVLGAGIVIAFVTLIAEIYWKNRVKQKLINKFRRCQTKVLTVKAINENNNEGIDK